MSAPDHLTVASRLRRYFPNPLADWDNDDLLLTTRAQHSVQSAYPAVFRVLDWPELREMFSRHDDRANTEKKKINRHGTWGALLTTLGVSCIALAPLLAPGWPQRSVVFPGCSLVVLGGLVGFSHLYLHDARNEWLIERIWTERLRQLYFQYILHNFMEVLAAIGDDAALETYRSARRSTLELFEEKLKMKLSASRKRVAIDSIANDHQDADLWPQMSWHRESLIAGISDTERVAQLMECLYYRRIEIQGIYAENNLVRVANSPRGMATIATTLSDLLGAIFVAALFSLALMWSAYPFLPLNFR